MVEYDPHDWWWHILDIQGSMVREILPRVLPCAVWATVVVVVHKYVHPVAFPTTVHALVGVAIGLLLVFRTNASYDRFWDGRKLWGSIVNTTRNLARESQVFLARDPELVESIIRWTAILPWVFTYSLRGRKDIFPAPEEIEKVRHTPRAEPASIWQDTLLDLAATMPREELQTVLDAQHPPLAVACRISALLQQGREKGLISDFVQLQLDKDVAALIDYIGGCERIQKTPLPFSYVVHLRRAVILYCFCLPFTIVKEFDWFTILSVAAVAFIYFGIEEIGVEIENPFGEDENDLPLEGICQNITRNLLALLPKAGAKRVSA
jgi:putative membrane protein